MDKILLSALVRIIRRAVKQLEQIDKDTDNEEAEKIFRSVHLSGTQQDHGKKH